MDFKFKHHVIINREKKTATMRLYGEIGDQINGHFFAREIANLDNRVDEINIHINSDGGDISHGLSIVSAITGANAVINTFIDGIAASMAAVIAIAGDNVFMNDFARLMIHDPFFINPDGDPTRKITPKQRKALESVKGILIKILSRRGKSEEEITKLMKNETWFTAETAKTEGFIDTIISTDNKTELAAMSPIKLVAKLNDEIDDESHININNMKKIISHYKLADDSTEAQVITAIELAETNSKAVIKKMAVKLIAFGLVAGIVTENNKDSMTALAEKDPDLFMGLIDTDKLKPVNADDGSRISNSIGEFFKNNANVNLKEKSFIDYGPDELREMKNSENKKFLALYKAYHGSDYKE